MRQSDGGTIMAGKQDSYEVIIIGGGLSGLAAAVYLGRGKKRVLLIEQSHSLGGRASTKQQDGFALNLGPHALYRSGPGIDILSEIGLEIRGNVPNTAGGFVVNNGVKQSLPAGFVSLLSTSLFGVSAKVETSKLLASLAKIDSSTINSLTVREWVDARLSNKPVRDLLLALFRLTSYANAPELMSAGAAVEQLQKALAKNVVYLDLGWQTLVDGLRDAAIKEGVEIRTAVKAESVEIGSTGEVTGVRLADNRLLTASAILMASSPGVAAALVKNTAVEEYARYAAPIEAACLDLALSRLPDPRASFALGIDQPYYFSVHSAAARLAPDGRALIHIAKYLAPDDAGSAQGVEHELESFADLIQPGWRKEIVIRRFLPRMVVSNAVPMANRGGLQGRPKPVVSEIPGLYLAGDWVGDEGQLADASLASAKKAAEAILSAPLRSSESRVGAASGSPQFQ